MGKVSIKNIVIFSGAICAYLIGSGFATGQEVLQFFTSSGTKGLAAALIFLVIMGAAAYAVCGTAFKRKFENPYDIFEYYCGKTVGKAYIWFSVVLNYCVFVVMLAGAGATINQYYGLPSYAGTSAVAFLALVTAVLGMQKLIKIVGVLGPIKIIFVSVLGIAAIIALVKQPSLLREANIAIPTLGLKTASANWAWSGALYALLCLMVSIPFIVSCASSAGNLSEAKAVGITAPLAFSVAVVLLIIAELVNYALIAGTQVPTLAMASSISAVFGAVFSIIIILAIYSAVSSLLIMTVRKFAVDKTRKFNSLAVILTAAGMLLGGLIPFDKLVSVMYPLAGYSGILFIILLIKKESGIEFSRKKSTAQHSSAYLQNERPTI